MLEIEASVDNNRPSCENCIKNLCHDWVIVSLTTKARVDAKVKLREHEDEVFVKGVEDQVRIASVRLPSMHEDQRLQECKLLDAEVCSGAGLCSLCPSDSNADVRLFNHRHVICPITNGQDHLASVLPHYGNQVRLLLWGHPACDYCTALRHHLLEEIQ
jgi:hypothetical protein